jgi:hypothetical protein
MSNYPFTSCVECFEQVLTAADVVDHAFRHRVGTDGLTTQTIHPIAECSPCRNDPEQCHASADCEARAWANGYCGPHQPDPRSYH